MIQFHETKRGRIYYDSLVPRMVRALEKIAGRMEKEGAEAAKKVFVYKEYCDRDAYGEELVEVYADQKTAEERLKRRVEGHFKKKWEKIPELFTEDDILLPDHVTFCDGDAMAFWTVVSAPACLTNRPTAAGITDGFMLIVPYTVLAVSE